MEQNNNYQYIYTIPSNQINNLQRTNRNFFNGNYIIQVPQKRKEKLSREKSSDNVLQFMGNQNNIINNFEGRQFTNYDEASKKEPNFIINNNNKIVNFKEENKALKEKLRIEKEKNNQLTEQLKKYEIQSLAKINELNCQIEELKKKFNNDILTIDQLKIYNGILQQKICEKEKEINNLKNNFENVNKDIQNLKKEIIEKNQKIVEMENKNNQNINLIYKFKNEIDGLNKRNGEEIIKLKRDIGQLKIEKNNLNNKIIQKDNELKNKMNIIKYRGEEMILKFKSMDQTIDYVIPCYNEDPFYIVEAKLYEKFKKYKEKNNIFIYGGKAILRFKSIKENKIDDSMPILLYVFNGNSNSIINSNILNSFRLLSNRNNNNGNNLINRGRNGNGNTNLNNNINNNIINNDNNNLTERSFMNFLNLLINLNNDNANMRIFQNQ